MADAAACSSGWIRLVGAATIVLSLLLPSPTPATGLPGAGEPDLDGALRAWLADNDATALPALAALAAEGNAAAQVMLSLVDRMPETHSDWLTTLPRDDRRTLMRAPGGRSWMEEAAREAPVALHWLALWDAETDPAVAIAFAELGETRAARLVLLAHHARERRGIAELAADALFPDELVYLALNEAPDPAERTIALDRLHPGDPQRSRLGEPPPETEALADWLSEAPLAAPVAAFCGEACADDAQGCMLAAYAALGGYRGLFALGPPSETLISMERWLASAKGAQSVPRRIALLRPPAIGDTCLARFVAD